MYLDVLVARNHGYELERRDASTLRAVWGGPSFLEANRIELADAASDENAIYVPVGQRIVALPSPEIFRVETSRTDTVPGVLA